MAYYFISDLHLDKSRPVTTDAFIEFISSIKNDARALYILGDFIEYWVGDDDDRHGLDKAFNALQHLSKTCPIYLMHGNRDFLIGERFAQQYGITLIHEPYSVKIKQHNIALSHGDILCTDDQDYLAFRQEVRSKDWQTRFLAQSLQKRIQTAEDLRIKSQQAMQTKSDALMDVNQDTVRGFFKQTETNTLIHGHTHRPAIHNHLVDNQHCQRIVLSDWHNQASYLKVTEHECELVTDDFIKTTTLIV